EPHRRYATASELAGDLERFLAGQPVHARPVPWWERGWKWARRRPAMAALGGGSTAALAGLLLRAGLYHLQLRKGWGGGARRQEDLQVALLLMDELTGKEFDPFDLELRSAWSEAEISRIRGLLEQLARENPVGPGYQSLLALFLFVEGDRHALANRPEDALAAFRASVEIRERLVRDYPLARVNAVNLSLSYAYLGHVLNHL